MNSTFSRFPNTPNFGAVSLYSVWLWWKGGSSGRVGVHRFGVRGLGLAGCLAAWRLKRRVMGTRQHGGTLANYTILRKARNKRNQSYYFCRFSDISRCFSHGIVCCVLLLAIAWTVGSTMPEILVQTTRAHVNLGRRLNSCIVMVIRFNLNPFHPKNLILQLEHFD